VVLSPPDGRFAIGGAQVEQFDLECLLQFIQLAAGDDWLPQKARVSRVTAATLSQMSNFSEVKAGYDERMTAIAFPSKLLAKAIPDSPQIPSKISSWESGPGSESPPSIAAAVSMVLESLLDFEALPTLEVMADRLGMNGRTLQRSLAGEDTSYRNLTERVIFRRAVSLLAESQLSVEEIASELGYSSASSFIRTFRRISGTTPRAYRKLDLVE
jgi:AraC-like DNA-binding protein